jgi:hypothetical protein
MAFHDEYRAFVEKHGELYENTQVPLDESDRKKYQGFFIAAVVILFLFVILFCITFYLNYPTSIEDSVYAVAMATFIIVGFIWSYRTKQRAIKKGTKTVIKGVITRMKVKARGKEERDTVTISEREDVVILSSDYDKYSLGDIVQIELLGSSWFRIAAAKVIYLGNISGDKK